MDTNETVIRKFHPHPFYFLGFYLGGIFVTILGFFFSPILIIAGILVFALGEVSRRAETLFILESGGAREYRLLSTSRKFTEFNSIQNIEVHQSFLENILGIGNVHIDTSGSDKAEINFHGIKNPYDIEHIIREKMKTI